MSFLNFFYSLIILPLENIIELVFNFTINKLSRLGIGGAIVCVSLAVNFLALPLYNIADSLQLKERNIQKNMEGWIRHIKKTFKGDEQYMMLSAYYRLNGYNPLYSLRSALSILIEIPFFIAAYHYLSNCDALKNQSFFLLRNLGEPDNLLKIGGFTIHLLPVIMTAINCVSGWVYSKDAPLREKIQIYALAAIFLVLLYSSPSGLVFYWILNNLFSLLKNVVQKYCRRPGLIVAVCLDTAFIFISLYFALFKPQSHLKKKLAIFYAITLFVIILPYFLKLYNKWYAKKEKIFTEHRKYYFLTFLFAVVSIALLCGALLPSSMISTSPVEFSFLGDTDSPLTYIGTSLLMSAGLFVVWPLAIYVMFGNRVKYALTYASVLGAMSALCNAFIFKQNYGTVSATGVLNNSDILEQFTLTHIVGPLLVIAITTILFLFLENKKKTQFVALTIFALCLGFSGLSAKNANEIKKVFGQYSAARTESRTTEHGNISPVFHLSKKKRNVFVFFLDRAIGVFAPYIFEEFPDLKDIYSGFTFYPNTISFSDSTNKGAPPLYGGYEYTPENMNLRKDELLLQKNNEALLVLPKIFSESGWRVTDYDPQNPNYSTIEDFSPFSGLSNTTVLAHIPDLTEKYKAEHPEINSSGDDKDIKKTMPRFAFMQTLLPIFREVFYNGGAYYLTYREPYSREFIKSYSELYYLNALTDFSSSENTYTIMHNMLTHTPTFLKAPYYIPYNKITKITNNLNCKYPYNSTNNFSDLCHYEVNAASLLRIAEWIKYLKNNSCYDNTRIIIVSDHGRDILQYLTPGFSYNTDYGCYQPLLMVKDFDSNSEIKTDNTFMTNADTPELSLENLGLTDTNPFTKKKLFGNKKSEYNLYSGQIAAGDWNTSTQVKNKLYNLYLERAYHIQDNIFDEKNWTPLKKWFAEHPEEKEKARAAGVKVDGGK